MSQLDVCQLPDYESLAEAAFPAPRRADFRVHIAQSVHQGIAAHARADTAIEICGILVGQWKQDADGPFAVAADYIRCDSASSKFAEVTFTHESWAQINHEMDTKYADSRIIGWYHSHPDFGIFLSDRDCFIQENFFSGAGQIAYVVDPVRKLEGVFAWRDGKPQPLAHYWVGDEIIPVSASEKPLHPATAGGSGAGASANPAAVSARDQRPTFDLSLVLLSVCLFLIGYLLASTKSRWEQERIIQGTVAHYGVNKLMRLGFEKELRETRERLKLIGGEVDALLELDRSQFNDEQRAEFDERKTRLANSLDLSRETLRKVEDVYGYTDLERAALANYMAVKQAELAGLMKSQGAGDQGGASQSSDASAARPAPGKSRVQGPPAPPSASTPAAANSRGNSNAAEAAASPSSSIDPVEESNRTVTPAEQPAKTADTPTEPAAQPDRESPPRGDE